MTTLWKPRDVMIDIETYATRNDAAIVQIGACTFDEKNEFLVSVDPAYYEHTDDYFIDPRTVEWWSTQGELAQASLNLNKVPNPGAALDELNKWLKSTGFRKSYRGGRSVWANGVQFDCSILRYAYSIEKGDNNAAPWHYRQEKDCRTLWQLLKNRISTKDADACRKGLTKHRADHDCIMQARGMKLLLDTIGEPNA